MQHWSEVLLKAFNISTSISHHLWNQRDRFSCPLETLAHGSQRLRGIELIAISRNRATATCKPKLVFELYTQIHRRNHFGSYIHEMQSGALWQRPLIVPGYPFFPNFLSGIQHLPPTTNFRKAHLGKTVSSTVTLDNCSAISFKVFAYLQPCSFCPVYKPKWNQGLFSLKDLYRNVYSSLFIMAPNWKQSRCLSTEKWINKLYFIHAME